MNLLLHSGTMFFVNQDGQGKLLHGGVMVSKALNPSPAGGGLFVRTHILSHSLGLHF